MLPSWPLTASRRRNRVKKGRIEGPMRCHTPFVNQVYAADCRRSMIARTSSILSSAMRSTGLAPSRSRCGLNSQTRASSGGYTWASWPANHSSRRSRSRLFGRGVDLPVCQRRKRPWRMKLRIAGSPLVVCAHLRRLLGNDPHDSGAQAAAPSARARCASPGTDCMTAPEARRRPESLPPCNR